MIFGHISMGKFKKDPNLGGRGMAIAGLVTGYIGILISVFLIIVAIVTTNSAINASGSSTFREAIEQSIKAQQDKQENITSPEPDSAEQSIQTEN